MALKQLSYTYLHTLSCSYQTFLRYEGHLRGKTTHYLALGNALHLALEKLYGEGPIFSPVLSLEETIKLFMAEFNRIITDEDVFVTYPQIKKAQSTGAEMLERYFAQMEEGQISKHPMAVETEFKLPIGDTIIVGKIDKVENHDGLTLIDYKSGSKKPEEWFLRRNLQFSAYALACKELYGEYPNKIIWHHLRTGSLIETSREEWDIDNLRRLVDSAVKMHDQGIRFRVYNEQVCGWCDFAGPNGHCDNKTLEAEIEQQILERKNADTTDKAAKAVL